MILKIANSLITNIETGGQAIVALARGTTHKLRIGMRGFREFWSEEKRYISKYLSPILVMTFALMPIQPISADETHSIEDFASQPGLSRAIVSPSGKYLAGVFYAYGAQAVFVDEIFEQEQPFVASGNKWKINWLDWVSDEDLLIGVSIPSQVMTTPVIITRLISVDMRTKKTTLMFKREDTRAFWQIQDGVIGKLPDKPGEFLLVARKNDERPSVLKSKVGDSKLRRSVAQGRLKDIYGWEADKLGNIRVGWGFTGDQKTGVLKLRDKNNNWHDHSGLLAREAEVLGTPTDNPSNYYISMFDRKHASSSDNSGDDSETDPIIAAIEKNLLRKVFKFNAETGDEELLYQHEQSEIAQIITDAKDTNVLEVRYSAEDIPPLVIDPQRLALSKAFEKNFPEAKAYIVSESDDRSMAIVAVNGPQTPIDYYLYMAKENRLNFLRSAYSSLNPKRLSGVHDISFAARDGLNIPGYLTLPPDISFENAKNLPVIVYPHGGPYARDFKRFDWVVQMLSAQGYAVLQINFRGSTGYGKAFEAAGRKQWGQAMQDDITDGTKWIIERGIADPNRIAIFGGSYGGYAALMGAAKEPDLYQCAVSLNGVTDLESLLRATRRYIGGKFSTRFIGNLWDDRNMLRANSPINLVDSINTPILLIHGEKDRVVDVKQSREMHKALLKTSNKSVQYLELLEGDHNLSGYENRLTFARTLSAFFEEHLKENSSTSADNSVTSTSF